MRTYSMCVLNQSDYEKKIVTYIHHTLIREIFQVCRTSNRCVSVWCERLKKSKSILLNWFYLVGGCLKVSRSINTLLYGTIGEQHATPCYHYYSIGECVESMACTYIHRETSPSQEKKSTAGNQTGNRMRTIKEEIHPLVDWIRCGVRRANGSKSCKKRLKEFLLSEWIDVSSSNTL